MTAGSYRRLSYCKLGDEQSKDIVGCQMRVAWLLTGVIHRRAVMPATGTSLDFPVAGDLRHRDEGFLQQTEESSLRRVLLRLPRSVSLAVPHRGTQASGAELGWPYASPFGQCLLRRRPERPRTGCRGRRQEIRKTRSRLSECQTRRTNAWPLTHVIRRAEREFRTSDGRRDVQQVSKRT